MLRKYCKIVTLHYRVRKDVVLSYNTVIQRYAVCESDLYRMIKHAHG